MCDVSDESIFHTKKQKLSSGNNEDNSEIHVKKRVTSAKTFQNSWLQEEKFRGWLQPVDSDKNKAFCRACNVAVSCGKSELEKHAVTGKHVKNVKQIGSNQSILSCFAKKDENKVHVDKVKTAEIKLATFFAEHNVAFQVVEHLIPVIKEVFSDSKIAADITLGRTKCTQVVKNIVAQVETEKTVETLNSHNSFVTRLKTVTPGLIVLNCICHTSAIIASKACEKLPRSCEELLRCVCSYISGSAKRCAILREFQEFFNTEQRKLLKLSGTRWLVLHQCVVRLLENWEPLQQYFQLAIVEDKLKSAEFIFNELQNHYTKAYLLFLKYVLTYFNSFNALFQSRKILIHKLLEASSTLINNFAQNVLKAECLNQLKQTNVNHPSNFLNLESIYLGPECKKFLQSLPEDCASSVQQFRLKCLEFYICATDEMKKRLPLDSELFREMKFVDPAVALEKSERNEVKDLITLASQIGGFDLNNLAVEWRSLQHSITDVDQKKKLLEMDIDTMWDNISQIRDFSDKLCFPNLSRLAKCVLSLPHSNAEAERIFSMVTDIKTKIKEEDG
ncbi:uncharacterized protein LOC134545381 [Bacillus rossius redtenbacheri]|uniref:uncharacterized protein LOC134545130 n=1 Tax=Bacillus rossius redtenbacheri TaxID=93214 RepID=UPI002FDD64E0